MVMVCTVERTWGMVDAHLGGWQADMPSELWSLNTKLAGESFDTYLAMGQLGCDIDQKDDFHIPGMVHKLLAGCGLKPFLEVLSIVDMGLGIDR
jgi:hypothetical protein